MASLRATTIERALATIGMQPNDPNHQELVEALVEEVSSKIEAYLARELLQRERVEVRDSEQSQHTWWLRAHPIQSIASVLFRAGVWADWADATLIDPSDYDFESSTGRLIIASSRLYGGPMTLQVTYTAGFGIDTDALVANYPDIASAADRQISHEWFRRATLDAASISVGGGASASIQREVRLLKAVKETLAAHRSIGVW